MSFRKWTGGRGRSTCWCTCWCFGIFILIPLAPACDQRSLPCDTIGILSRCCGGCNGGTSRLSCVVIIIIDIPPTIGTNQSCIICIGCHGTLTSAVVREGRGCRCCMSNCGVCSSCNNSNRSFCNAVGTPRASLPALSPGGTSVQASA